MSTTEQITKIEDLNIVYITKDARKVKAGKALARKNAEAREIVLAQLHILLAPASTITHSASTC